MVTAIVLFGWTCIIGAVVLVAYLTNDSDDDWTSSKAYKDLNDTMLNRNEDV